MSGLALVSAGRKSRKGDDTAVQFARGEARNSERAARDGHTIIHTTRDVVSSQTMPWERRDLKAWMTDPAKMALYDGILVETDRLARVDDKGWHYIEHWCYENAKRIVTTEGVQFPPRDASDKYQWIGLKDRARSYWEDTRDKHAGARAIIRANGGAIGLAPFGYRIEGAKYSKRFVIDPITGPLAKEAFKRIARGATATSVAQWLTDATSTLRTQGDKPYKPWRVKRVTDMIGRRSYLGARDGHAYEAIVTEALFNSANSALAARSYSHSDSRRGVHAYSGVILCECLAPLYHHQSTKGGEPVGSAHYRCARGIRNVPGEARCGRDSLSFDAANLVIDAYMLEDLGAEYALTTTGGDHGKRMELARLDDEMRLAMAKHDMALVRVLSEKYEEAKLAPSEPVSTEPRLTGRTRAQCWEDGSVSCRRTILSDLPVIVAVEGSEIIARYVPERWLGALGKEGA